MNIQLRQQQNKLKNSEVISHYLFLELLSECPLLTFSREFKELEVSFFLHIATM